MPVKFEQLLRLHPHAQVAHRWQFQVLQQGRRPPLHFLFPPLLPRRHVPASVERWSESTHGVAQVLNHALLHSHRDSLEVVELNQVQHSFCPDVRHVPAMLLVHLRVNRPLVDC